MAKNTHFFLKKILRKRHFMDAATVIISLCALGLTVWQGIEIRKNSRETQRYNRLSVKPYLTSWASMQDGHYKYELINNGLGPALIENLIIKIDGQQMTGEEEYDAPVKNGVQLLFPNNIYSYDINSSFIGKGYAIPPKDRIIIADILFNNKERKTIPTKKFIENTIKNHAELIVKYKSVYGEEFSFDSR